MKPWRKMTQEQTYGWYPAVRDIYLSKNNPTPYHLECLYKFKGSGYHNPAVEPPEPALLIRGITPTPTPPSSRPSSSAGRHGARSVPVPKFRPVPKLNIPTPLQAWKQKSPAETSWGVVIPAYSPKEGQATSSQKQEHYEQTESSKPGVVWPGQQIMSKYDKEYVQPPTGTCAAEEVFGSPMPPTVPGSGQDCGYIFIPTGDGGVEVSSPLPIYWPDSHPRPLTPQHSASSKASLGSAEGIRARRKVQEEYQEHMTREKEEARKQVERQRHFDSMLRQQYQHKNISQPQRRISSSNPGATRGSQMARRERVQSATTQRDKTPVPKRQVCSARPCRPASDTAVYTQRNYHDKMQDQAGDMELLYRAWEDKQLEVTSPERPDNPLPPTTSMEDLLIEEDRSPSPDYQEVVDKFGWRAQVHGDPYNIKTTTKRLPYTVKCEEPVIPPEAPATHMESKETFFLNTIPRRLATFTVHQDWLSEGLCAQKAQLQKRQPGINYRYKNFAFAY